MSRAAGTVKAKLFALCQMHVMGGYPDPLQGKPRLWMALKGLERRGGPARRKLPTTPGMLKWIRTQLRPETCANDAVLWAVLVLAFFFLMRVGEYAFSGHWDLKKVLTPADFKGQAAGQPVTDYRRADEVLLRFESSKADQEGAGATRNHYRTNERLCPVEVVELLQRHLGHRMARELHEPLTVGGQLPPDSGTHPGHPGAWRGRGRPTTGSLPITQSSHPRGDSAVPRLPRFDHHQT